MEEKKSKTKNDIGYGVKFIDPDSIIGRLEIIPGMTVAVFGSGSGYFAISLAQKVGQDGKVFALDILREKLESVESWAKMMGLTNILTKRVNLEKEKGSELEAVSTDWVFLVNMLYQNKDKEAVMRESKRVLKNGGRALVVEWEPHDSSIGPERDLKIAKEKMLQIVQKAGLALVSEIDLGNFHYGLEFIN